MFKSIFTRQRDTIALQKGGPGSGRYPKGSKGQEEIKQGGMGGFLNPPGHPEHTHSVEMAYGSGSISLSSAKDDESLQPETRAKAKELLDNWEKNKLPLEHPEVQDWVRQNLGYFKDMYKDPANTSKDAWNATNLKIEEKTDPLANTDRHAGVRSIRQYYPEYKPKAEHFKEAYWGRKSLLQGNIKELLQKGGPGSGRYPAVSGKEEVIDKKSELAKIEEPQVDKMAKFKLAKKRMELMKGGPGSGRYPKGSGGQGEKETIEDKIPAQPPKITPEEALQAVLSESKGGFADYAKTYAQAGLELGGSTRAEVKSTGAVTEIVHEKTGKTMVDEEMRVQMLYVLSNLSGWKGERAREVKDALKYYSKQK